MAKEQKLTAREIVTAAPDVLQRIYNGVDRDEIAAIRFRIASRLGQGLLEKGLIAFSVLNAVEGDGLAYDGTIIVKEPPMPGDNVNLPIPEALAMLVAALAGATSLVPGVGPVSRQEFGALLESFIELKIAEFADQTGIVELIEALRQQANAKEEPTHSAT